MLVLAVIQSAQIHWSTIKKGPFPFYICRKMDWELFYFSTNSHLAAHNHQLCDSVQSMLILVLPAAGNVLFFHHTQLCVSFLPPRPHDTHSLFDWHLTLMIHTLAPICLSAFHSSAEAFRFFVFLVQERSISQFVQTFFLSFGMFASRCVGYLDMAHAVHAELQSRTAGCVVVILQVLVMPGKLPRSPSVSCSVVHVCLCVYPRLCLSVLAHIQNGKRQKQPNVLHSVTLLAKINSKLLSE